jgi:hypothetical protein
LIPTTTTAFWPWRSTKSPKSSDFYLQTVSEDEIELVRSHQALATLKKPQPTKTAKGVLTIMDLKLVSASTPQRVISSNLTFGDDGTSNTVTRAVNVS